MDAPGRDAANTCSDLEAITLSALGELPGCPTRDSAEHEQEPGKGHVVFAFADNSMLGITAHLAFAAALQLAGDAGFGLDLGGARRWAMSGWSGDPR